MAPGGAGDRDAYLGMVEQPDGPPCVPDAVTSTGPRSRRKVHEDHLHLHRRGSGARDALASCPSSRRSRAPPASSVELRDISLAGRILAQFPERLTEEQRVARRARRARRARADARGEHHQAAQHQRLGAAAQGGGRGAAGRGLRHPRLPGRAVRRRRRRPPVPPTTRSRARPSTRSCARATRTAARPRRSRSSPPSTRIPWAPGRRSRESHVATMGDGDFRSTETSVTMPAGRHAAHRARRRATATVTVLKDGLEVQEGEIVDSAVMRRAALDAFLAEQIADAKAKGVLFSLHLKATMMKVSDPIIFGHGVRAFFPEIFAKHGDALGRAGRRPEQRPGQRPHGARPAAGRREGRDRGARSTAAFESGPDIAMVDSDRGITNLHVPSDVIIDASMPAMIRTSGQMWNRAGDQQDAKAVIPDSSYARAVRGDRSTSAASTARSTRRRWARRRTSASWRRRPRSTARTTRRSRSPRPAPSGSSTPRARRCSSSTSRPATSGAPARRRTRRSSTGSASRSRAREATGAPAVFWLDETRAHDARAAEEGPRGARRSSTPRARRSRSCPSPRRPASRSSAPRAARTRSR